MKRFFRRGVFALLLALPLHAAATVQLPEVLVVGNDTLRMFAMPLESAPLGVRERLRERLDAVAAPMNTVCWRRYVGYWRLSRGVLWLESVKTCRGETVMTGAELLPQYASADRAWAPWVNGDVRCGSGEVVCPQEGFHLERERQLHFRGGCVTRCRTYENRAYSNGIALEENARRFQTGLDTARFGASADRSTFQVRFTADSTGRVIGIERASLIVGDPSGTDAIVDDPRDRRVKEAMRAFRIATRWNACRIDGEWKPQHCVLPLKRSGGADSR